MAKKRKDTDQTPLSHFWMPPTTIVEEEPGCPLACLATTFEFDAAFFESELLPRFLGLKFDNTENEPSFLVEREDALTQTRVCALVDHSKFSTSQTTMRWYQIPIQIPGGIQHAKITILVWERLIRVIIGSANLTRAGYRKNRELFAALDFWNGQESTPLSLLRETLDLVTVMLTWSRAAESAVRHATDTVDQIRATMDEWDEAPIDFTPRERPRASLAVTHPGRPGQPARSALEEVITRWGSRRATSIVVVSPFAASQPDPEVGDPVVNRLAEIPRSADCQGWLVAPELPSTPEDQRTFVPFHEVLGRSWKELFDGRGGAYVLPLPRCVEGKKDRNRELHSKSVVLENKKDDVALMMIGSSNFTPRGMGVGIYNFEANLIFEDARTAKRDGMRLVDRLGLPRDWNEALLVDEVVWQTPEERPEDEPDPQPALPDFFAWATFSQTSGEIKLRLDRTRQEPATWSVRLPGGEIEAPTMFASHFTHTGSSSELTHVLPEAMRRANIVALLVQWQDENGEIWQAILSVTIEGEEHLLPPEQFQNIGADAIIQCLISGKTPSQWFDQNVGKGKHSVRNDAAVESLRSVDTSSFLLYRVRRFGRALAGMSQRILRTMPFPDALRYRLQKDPFGPISLAQSIMKPEKGANDGWCAQLDSAHRVFLVAEIILVVAHLRLHMKRMVKKKQRKAIATLFSETLQELRRHAEAATTSGDLPDNLRNYLATVNGLAFPNDTDRTEVRHVD